MKTLLPFAAATLAAVAAGAQGTAAQTMWPLATDAQVCTISQSFADPDFGNHTLAISYDAARQEVSLITTNAPLRQLPDAGDLAWHVVLLDNGTEKHDDAWGARRFSYARDGEDYRFATRFAGKRNVRQILADLAGSRGIGFLEGGDVVTAYDLTEAGSSIARLRECAARAVAAN